MLVDLHSAKFKKEVHDACLKLKKVLGKKRKVGLYLDQSVESVILLLACIKLGLKVAICPLKDPLYTVNTWLKKLDIKILFLSNSVYKSNEFELQQFCLSELVIPKKNKKILDNKKSFSSLIKTSGTTSYPKTALTKYAAHMSNAQSLAKYFGLGKSDTWLLNLPLYHVSGLSIIFRSMVSKARVFVACDQNESINSISNRLVTHVSLVPYLLEKLIDLGVELACLKAVFIGGDALSSKLAEYAKSKNINIYESYALTELSSTVMIKNIAANESFFKALSHVKVNLTINNELVVKSKSLFSGYVGKKSVLKQGWFYTGDLFIKNAHGYSFAGRKNNRIVSAGENIQAEEVERAINAHPLVKKSLVVPIFHACYGQRPVAFVDANQEVIALLKDFLKLKLAAFKVPDKFFMWPKDCSAHKINRKEFQQKYL